MCPYFSSSSFCPRREFCKLRHISQSSSAADTAANPIDLIAKSLPTSPLKVPPPSPDRHLLLVDSQPTLHRSVSTPSHSDVMRFTSPHKQLEQGNAPHEQKQPPLLEKADEEGGEGHVVATDAVSPASPEHGTSTEWMLLPPVESKLPDTLTQKSTESAEAPSLPSTFTFSSERQDDGSGIFVFSAGDSANRRVLGKRKNVVAGLFGVGHRKGRDRSEGEEVSRAKRRSRGEEPDESELGKMADLAVNDDDAVSDENRKGQACRNGVPVSYEVHLYSNTLGFLLCIVMEDEYLNSACVYV